MSSSDLSDSDYDEVDNLTIENGYHRLYQVQFVSDEYYKFSLLGYFKEPFTIELTRFEHDNTFCVINTNLSIIDPDDLSKDGSYLYDLITMDVIKDDKMFKIILCVEMENPKIDKENKGNLMIWVEYNNKRTPIKTNLSHPGNDKIPYYLITELLNEKILNLIN